MDSQEALVVDAQWRSVVIVFQTSGSQRLSCGCCEVGQGPHHRATCYIISLDDPLGNTVSDILANLGVSKHVRGLDALGRVYLFRRMLLQRVVCAIHEHMALVFQAYRLLDERSTKNAWLTKAESSRIKPSLPELICLGFSGNLNLQWPCVDIGLFHLHSK